MEEPVRNNTNGNAVPTAEEVKKITVKLRLRNWKMAKVASTLEDKNMDDWINELIVRELRDRFKDLDI
jgi:hypothetical protein